MTGVDAGAAVAAVRARVIADGGPVTGARIAEAARAERVVWAGQGFQDLVEAVRAELVGLGPLEPLLVDEGVTDVVVNGPDAVYVDRGRGLERASVGFPDAAAVAALATRLAAAAGRRLDEAAPWADVRLPDGSRLHAVLASVAAPGPCLSLRVPRRRGASLEQLVGAEAADLLRRVVEVRASFLVTGGTGSGKTTLLGALLSTVDPRERVVCVEDPRELRIAHDHVVSLEARPPNVEGAGGVTARQLVREALRMRPDRLVVGEARGAEVVDLLAALNTGHSGGAGTLHARGPAEVPARVEALAVVDGLHRSAAHSLLAAAVDLVLHVGRDADGRRGLRGVGVLEVEPDGRAVVRPAAVGVPGGELRPAEAAPRLAALLSAGPA